MSIGTWQNCNRWLVFVALFASTFYTAHTPVCHLSENCIIRTTIYVCQNACTSYKNSITVEKKYCQCAIFSNGFFSNNVMLTLHATPHKTVLPWQFLRLQQGHGPSVASPLWTLTLVFTGALGQAVSTTVGDATQVAAVCLYAAPLRPSILTVTALALKGLYCCQNWCI